MTLETITTRQRGEVIEMLSRHLDSPVLLYVAVQCRDGEYTAEVIQPTKEAIDTAACSTGVSLPVAGSA